MAKRKSLTGFARLIIALIILVPSAFIGASYINGEDPVQNFKEVMGWETSSSTSAGVPSSNRGNSSSGDNDTRGSENTSREYVKHLEQKVAVLEEQLARCQASAVD